MTNIKKITAITIAMICIFSCKHKNKNESNQWNETKIDSTISSDSIYKFLDKQKEIFSVFEKQDSLMKRTSDVAYFSGEKINLANEQYSKFNNCRAYFLHSDTLFIDIGIGNGFVDQGFIIHYKDKKFYTEPYFSTDVIIPGEPEPSYKIVYQELILDKANYKPGDSLYGKVDFRSIETKSEKIVEHFGKGYFRAKVRG